jgi:hypothetical protein
MAPDVARSGESVVLLASMRKAELRLAEIKRLRREISALQAQLAVEVTGYVDQRLTADAELGVPDGPSTRCMAAEVALAAGVSVITAQSLMSDCWDLVTNNPATLAALRAGDLQWWVARQIATETGVIAEPRLRALADRVIAQEAVDVVPGKVKTLAQRRVLEVDPDAAARRSDRARRDAHVRLTPADSPGTATLAAFLPAEQAVACRDALRREARARKGRGSPGRLGELMTQVLFERVTGAGQVTDLTTQVAVVMTDTTLFGSDDQPGHLIGYGPLPAHVARLLATHDNAWLRRFYTDPVDGSISLADAGRRRFDGALREIATFRDQYCRGIQCASPITDHDHVQPHAEEGPTTLANDQGLSANCHHTRDHPGMTVIRDPDTGVTSWHTPTGLTYRNLPPPALGHGSATPAQNQLRRLLLNPSPSRHERHLLTALTRHLRTPQPRPGIPIHTAWRHQPHRPDSTAAPPGDESRNRRPAPPRDDLSHRSDPLPANTPEQARDDPRGELALPGDNDPPPF